MARAGASRKLTATGEVSAERAPWHAWSLEQCFRRVGVDPGAGLKQDEARRRLEKHGPNELAEAAPIRPLKILLAQFGSIIVWILVAAALVAGVTAEWADCVAILAIVVLNALIGFSQEYHAEQSIAALRRMTAPQARVRRDGASRIVPAREVVPGDVIELEAGDLVAADARLIDAASLAANEASLTGESVPVEKDARWRGDATAPLADRLNMVHLGTSVASGRASAVVVATGMATEIGAIAGLIGSAADDAGTPLQRRLEAFGKLLAWSTLGIVAVVFVAGWLRHMPELDLLLTSISLAVAAVPEGLPAIVTIALAVGVQRMARRRSLIRRLHAVETLGSANVICSDKTGTLTVGEMTVRALWTADARCRVLGEGYAPHGEVTAESGELPPSVHELARLFAGCNGARLREADGVWTVVGDPTEGALLAAAGKLGITPELVDAETPVVRDFPFDSDRKRMTVVRRLADGTPRAMVKGAPDVILARCTHGTKGGAVVRLDDAARRAIVDEVRSMGGRALRVLAAARRDLDGSLEGRTSEDVETGLVFVGLAGMQDPPRPEARRAVDLCRSAGVRVVMITGDHPETALAIARELGIAGPRDRVVSGQELDLLDDVALQDQARSIAVFARVTAAHKLRIVRALAADGAVVAMTGDGVNDAPAIQGADIGIAMGRTGTEVTKEASDMVITDDNFATIVAAVEEGRGIYANIRKTILYLLGGNVGELLFVTTCVVAGLPMPLAAIQLLWINLVTDGLPALCLATDPLDPDVMRVPPRAKGRPLADRSFVVTMLWTGALTAATTMAGYLYSLRTGSVATAQDHAFAAFVFIELLISVGFRSETKPVWRMSLRSNLRLLIVVIAGIGFQLAAPHLPFFADFLKVMPMSMKHCVSLLAVAFVPVAVLELLKVGRARSAPR
jgi:Ca2+-transporting ATPase